MCPVRGLRVKSAPRPDISEIVTMNTDVLIVDDHPVIRRGVRMLLSSNTDYKVVGEVNNGREAVEAARKLEPAVVLMDPAMPELNGMDATTRIRAELPGTVVLALSMHSDEQYVSRMLAAGAAGYLLKTCDAEELFRAIDVARKGQTYVAPEVAGAVVDGYVIAAVAQHLREPDDSEADVGKAAEGLRCILSAGADGATTALDEGNPSVEPDIDKQQAIAEQAGPPVEDGAPNTCDTLERFEDHTTNLSEGETREDSSAAPDSGSYERGTATNVGPTDHQTVTRKRRPLIFHKTPMRTCSASSPSSASTTSPRPRPLCSNWKATPTTTSRSTRSFGPSTRSRARPASWVWTTFRTWPTSPRTCWTAPATGRYGSSAASPTWH